MSTSTGTAGERPLVTAAFPLYRSERFIPLILENIRGLDYPNLEILLSDRHGDTATMDRLRSELAGNRSVRFLQADDGIGWVRHYNFLMSQGRGDYFCWLPHDDRLPPGYLPRLVDVLNGRPDAVIAFGRIRGVRLDASTWEATWDPFPHAPNRPWDLSASLDLLSGWELGIAVRGLWRRAPVLEREVVMRETRGTIYSDRLWVFAISLLGSLVEVPDLVVEKHLYDGSTHRKWRWTPVTRASYVATGFRYLLAGLPPGRARRAALARYLALHLPLWAKAPWRALAPSWRRRIKRGLRVRTDDLIG